MIERQRIVQLLYRHVKGEVLNEGEKKELDDWIAGSPYNKSLYKDVMNQDKLQGDLKTILNYKNSKALWNKIIPKISPKKNNLISIFRNRSLRYAAAAVLLITISTITYVMFVNPDAGQQPVSGNQHLAAMPDVSPGTEKAVLTLADGTTIVLDSLANGAIAHQGNTVIMKEDGLLAYNADNKNLPSGILYNTITVPRGGEYKSLVLADGTKVWLNSLSSMRFPTAFSGKQRIVEITGEVYFDVTKNPSRPFKVKANEMEVEVLGTHFNINAYTDENSITTSLLEGSVRVRKGIEQVVIKPGQQTQVIGNIVRMINDADVNAAVAWKNGLLVFNKTDIKVILRQISRWYDVDIEYKGDIKVPKFYGEIPRSVTLSEVLKIIEVNSKLQFTIEGKKVIVEQPKRI